MEDTEAITAGLDGILAILQQGMHAHLAASDVAAAAAAALDKKNPNPRREDIASERIGRHEQRMSEVQRLKEVVTSGTLTEEDISRLRKLLENALIYTAVERLYILACLMDEGELSQQMNEDLGAISPEEVDTTLRDAVTLYRMFERALEAAGGSVTTTAWFEFSAPSEDIG